MPGEVQGYDEPKRHGEDLALIRAALHEAQAVAAHRSSAGHSRIAALFEPPSSDSFPGYEITREIHRGGQGVVYQAIQINTRRKIAIKVMREGPFASVRDRARFEREVHILSQLNHPNIVAIHDSGEAAGHHFFVMDYISGHRLDTYMAGRERSVKDTLQLFVKICDAVNVAHLRGIIHRDLKPGNIRVDPSGEPHVLDFGLAKVSIYDDLADSRPEVMTITGQFIGSLPWASPEQAEGAPELIDIRTDVYSLGVILFQMLTSRFPYVVVGPMREVLETIMHTPPTKPSSLRREVDDEVQTIVLKCLAKERDRRYQSAGELARDIRHYLADEPIEAKRDSVGYMLRKTIRRYRLPAAVAAGFVLLLAAGLITSLTLWGTAARERDRAVLAEQRETAERRMADEARVQAESARDAEAQQRLVAQDNEHRAVNEAAKAQAVSGFLEDMLRSVRPEEAMGRDVTVREALDEAARSIAGGSLKDQPEIEAAVQNTIGNAYHALGLYDAAEPHLRAALDIRTRLFGEEHADVATSMNDLAQVLHSRVDLDGSEALVRRALAIRQRLLGPDHGDIAQSMNSLGLLLRDRRQYDAAEQMLHDALAMHERMNGERTASAAATMNNLAMVLQSKHDYAAAESLYRQALAIRIQLMGENHPVVATTLNNLGTMLRENGRYDEAEPLYRRALEIKRLVLGPAHPDLASTINNLALLLKSQQAFDESESLYRESLSIYISAFGEDHPKTAMGLMNLAALLESKGDYAAAEPPARQAVDICRRTGGDADADLTHGLNVLGRVLFRRHDYAGAEVVHREALERARRFLSPDDPYLAVNLGALASDLNAVGRSAEAEPLYREAVAIHRRADTTPTMELAKCLNNLATMLDAADRLDEAEALYRESLEIHRGNSREDSMAAASSLNNLASLLAKSRRAGEAEPLYRQCLEIQRRALGPDHPELATTMNNLAMLLVNARGDLHEAQSLLREGLAIKIKAFGATNPATGTIRQNLARCLIAAGQSAQAEPVLRELLDIRTAALPADDWRIAGPRSMLGGVLTEQSRFEEAEPLLLQAAQTLHDNSKAPAAYRRAAVQRLVKLYQAWNKPDLAEQWRAKLPATSADSGSDDKP